MPRVAAIVVFCLAFALPATAAVTVILTRHAEVLPGDNPSLSSRGKARAELLADMLTNVPIDAIFVSKLKRTQETASVVAARHHLSWAEKSEPEDLAKAIHERTSGIVLVVGHSNTVPETIALLGGPTWQIGERDFNNLFIVTLNNGQASAVRLLYGAPGQSAGLTSKSLERAKIMEISFVKSGGIAGPMTRVQGTIHFKDTAAEVTGDAAYSRQLAQDEADMLRAGADPNSLKQTANQLAARQSSSRGAADMDHYTITIKTADGKTQNITLNSSGGSEPGVSPATAKFLSWLQQESQSILRAKMQSK